MPILDVNTDQFVVLSNKLEKIHRSAFPVAARQTLNKAAFFTRKNTLQIEARKQFIIRKPSFFRAFSSVDKATGFNVRSMTATVGMTDKNESSRNLKYQERGGSIQNRDFIATDAARTGKSKRKPISKRSRASNIKIVKASNRGTKKQRFVKAAIVATQKYGKSGHVLMDNSLIRINKAMSNLKSRKLVIATTKVYDYKKGRSVRIEKHPFVAPAAQRSGRMMEKWFRIEAEKQFKRLAK